MNNILLKILPTHESFWNSIMQHIVNVTVVVMQYFAIPRQNGIHV
jgi:hypothetical protein